MNGDLSTLTTKTINTVSVQRYKPYPDYRDSGVEWLGKVPEGWNVRKLKHIASVKFSSVNKKTEDGEHPVCLCNYVDVYYNDYITPDLDLMKATASFAEIKNFSLREGDILITKDSESWDDIAVPAYVSSYLNNVLCGYHLAQIRPNISLSDGEYLFRSFYAHGINDQFRVAATGVTRYGLGKYWLDNSLFLVPPLPEQRAIAAFLDSETGRIDVLIEKKERQIELLQEKRAALISHAVTKGSDPEVKMKDSGVEWLGEIPEHWEVNRIATVFRQRDERGRDDLPVLSVSLNTGVEERDFSNNRIQPKMSDYSQYKITYSGDIVFNKMRMWQGAVGVAPCDGFVSPDYTVAVPFQDVCSKFYEYLFRTRAFTAEVMRYSHGIALDRNRLYWDGFKQIKVPVMTFSEQNEISSYLGRTIGGIDILSSKISESISKLREYRTALISAAVTGKIDVRNKET